MIVSTVTLGHGLYVSNSEFTLAIERGTTFSEKVFAAFDLHSSENSKQGKPFGIHTKS